MKNLYEIYKEMQKLNNDRKEERKRIEEEENFLDFKEDLQEVLCDILKTKERHYVPEELCKFYEEEIGIKCKENKDFLPIHSAFAFGRFEYMFLLNKTNIKKIDKYLIDAEDNE